jgi:inosine/xanthosine triphosphatase
LKSEQLNVIVGSLNPVKVKAALGAISALFPEKEINCTGIHAPSQVADQPMNAAETRQGAINRTKYCQQQTQATFYVAMEGGVDLFEDGPATFAYIAIAGPGRLSVGRTAILPLPDKVYAALQQGQELGDVMDTLFNTENIKQRGGAIGLLTHGRATRESSYTQALTLAMAPFLHPELYEP